MESLENGEVLYLKRDIIQYLVLYRLNLKRRKSQVTNYEYSLRLNKEIKETENSIRYVHKTFDPHILEWIHIKLPTLFSMQV